MAAHDKSARELKKMEGAIAKMKRTYYESLDHCQEEESEIDARIGPLERMMEEVREEQQKVRNEMVCVEEEPSKYSSSTRLYAANYVAAHSLFNPFSAKDEITRPTDPHAIGQGRDISSS